MEEIQKCFLLQRDDINIGMLLCNTKKKKSSGIVVLDRNNVIREFHEKTENPPGQLANAAVYMFKNNIFDQLRAKRRAFIDLSTEIIPFQMGKIVGYGPVPYHRDIGTIQSWLDGQFDYNGPIPEFPKTWMERCGLSLVEVGSKIQAAISTHTGTHVSLEENTLLWQSGGQKRQLILAH